MNICNDIWHSIIGECSTENIRKLGCINNDMAPIITQYLNKRYIKLDPDFNILFYQRLIQYDFDPTIFSNMMKRTNSMICGSYPLSCVLFEEYKYSYINIYTRHIDTNEQFGNINEHEQFHKFIKYNKYCSEYYEDTHKDGFKYMTNIEKVMIYNMGSMRIRIIYVDPTLSIIDFMEKNFDLSITKTVFNGDNMYLYNEETMMKIGYISDSHIVKDDYTKEQAQIFLERIAKYLDRGFSIHNFEYFISKHTKDTAFKQLLNIYGNFR